MSYHLDMKNIAENSLLPKALCALGLTRHIIGVTFFFDRRDYEASSVRPLKTTMSYCALARLATLGHGRKTDAAGISCPGARRALGFVPPDEEFSSGRRYQSLGMYKDLECARLTAAEVSLMPEAIAGVAVQPLSRCQAPPQVVLAICNPNQAMRLVQGYIHQFGPPPPMTAMGMQGLCAELTVRPHVARAINVSLLCSNTRFTCAWGDHEMGTAMPYAAFMAALRGVLGTLNASESDKSKRVIAARARDGNLDMDIRPGSAYYAPPSARPARSADQTPAQRSPATSENNGRRP